MKEFVDFLLTKVYQSKPISDAIIQVAFEETILDVNYHFPTLSKEEIKNRIETNNNELAIFLFRLGREIHKKNCEDLKFIGF